MLRGRRPAEGPAMTMQSSASAPASSSSPLPIVPTPGPPPMTKTTAAFYAMAAISFGASLLALGLGIAYLPVDRWVRAFLVVGALYAVTSTFTLAKVVRDQQEAAAVHARVDQARMERLLVEVDPYRPT